MEKKYAVKYFTSETYYCGIHLGWIMYDGEYKTDVGMVHFFDSIEDAENFIETENGTFQIEKIYII
jgi:hypothetical protein